MAIRKLALALIPLIASASVFAQENSPYGRGYDHGYEDGYDDAMMECPCPPGRILLSGLYTGLGVGYEGFQVNTNPFLDRQRIGSFTTHANGWRSRLFAGYAYYFYHYYMAAELFLGMSRASGNNYIDTAGTQYYGSFQSGNSVGLSFLPGFKLNDGGPLFYGRLGYIRTELNANDWSGNVGGRHSDCTSGFQSGVGIEMPLFKLWSARVEYDHVKYTSINHNTNTAGSTNSPSSNGAEIDLIYHFNPRF